MTVERLRGVDRPGRQCPPSKAMGEWLDDNPSGWKFNKMKFRRWAWHVDAMTRSAHAIVLAKLIFD